MVICEEIVLTDCVSYCKTECKWTWFFKRNHSQMFYKIGVIKNFSILRLKHLRPVTPFPVNLVKFLRTPEHHLTTASGFFYLFYCLFFFFIQRTNRNQVFFYFLMFYHGLWTWWIHELSIWKTLFCKTKRHMELRVAFKTD